MDKPYEVPLIELRSGELLNLADPDPAMITPEIIAHALSNVCRFAGHTRRFYSVAEHALLVEMYLLHTNAHPLVQYYGLHHDDAEAFVHDVTRPLKILIPEYAMVEQRVMAAINQALPDLPDITEEDAAAIKVADSWALSCEAWHLMESRGKGWWCEGLYEPSSAFHVTIAKSCHVKDLGASRDAIENTYLQIHYDLLDSIANRGGQAA